MTRCSACYSGCQDLCKAKKHWLHTLTIYYSIFFSTLAKNLGNLAITLQITCNYTQESEDCFYLTELISEFSALDVRATAALSQHLSEVFHRNQCVNHISLLSPHIQYFESIFMKKDFNILPDHCKQNHTIELTPSAEPKSKDIVGQGHEREWLLEFAGKGGVDCVTNSAFSYTLQNVYYLRSFNWPISYASQSLWQNI